MGSDLSDRLISKDGWPELLSVLAHEMRHAEQTYLRSKYLLEDDYTEESIHRVLYEPT